MKWIYSPKIDLIFILSPPFIILGTLFLFSDSINLIEENYSTIEWFILIVCIDVAHVWSTLFKTYLNKDAFLKRKNLYLITPLICFILSILFLQIGTLFFWSILAYIAVFHFIRQQYGFMKLYSSPFSKLDQSIDTIAIYTATVYPMLYWFSNIPRKFNWFVDNEFVHFINEPWLLIAQKGYIIIFATYVVKEIYFTLRFKKIQWSKNLLILGTTISWYFGIIYFNNDFAFTALNVISHGIPYISLIYLREIKPKKHTFIFFEKILYSPYSLIFFLFSIVLLGFFEEYLWEIIVWKERFDIHIIWNTPWVKLSTALLMTPQFTHYILDGFIWKQN